MMRSRQKQPLWAQGISVENIALFVGGNAHAGGKEFALDDHAVGVLQIDRAQPHRFDFGAEQFDARFVGLVDVVVVPGFFVLRYDLFCFFFGQTTPPPFNDLGFAGYLL